MKIRRRRRKISFTKEDKGLGRGRAVQVHERRRGLKRGIKVKEIGR